MTKKTKNKSFLKKIANGQKSIDIFGEKVNFNIDGADSHKSFFGAFVTIIITLIVLSYGLDKFILMTEYRDTIHQETTDTGAIDSEKVFPQSDTQVNVAFSVYDIQIDGSGGTLPQQDYNSYLSFVPSLVTIDTVDGIDLKIENLSYHECTEADFDVYFKGSRAEWTTDGSMPPDFTKMLCLDEP